MMKSKLFFMFTIVTTMLLVTSCAVTSHDYNIKLSCDELMESKHFSSELQVEVGDKLRMELCSNPTTGFKWDYELTVENVVNEEDHDFEEPSRDIVGGSGTEFWTFEAIEKGMTELRMEYSQPWEGGLKAEQTYTISITVE